ncbi:N-acetylmuramoyl-L-alanine amidase [Porphyromonadaceae bacterium W3.11]|nr:N-acetylmuramoyl-L-alanine amidase [Porphyromonadaceae bacterium W3.11]
MKNIVNMYSGYRALEPEYQPRLVRHKEELVRARRLVRMLVIHCSATRWCERYTPEQLVHDHLERGYNGAGYHYYITREGMLYEMRPVEYPGAHAKGYNRHSIGICYEGGLDRSGNPVDSRTSEQKQMLKQLICELKRLYGDVLVMGHRDLSPDLNGDGQVTREEWMKACPCFDARVYNALSPSGGLRA